MSETAATVLDRLANGLVGAASSRTLLSKLESLLQDLDCCPARLYLADQQTGTFYPVAGFACETEADELAIAEVQADSGDEQVVLRQDDDIVGLLTLASGASHQISAQLGSLLGPVLVSVQSQEQTVQELRQVHEKMSHLVAAGQLLRHLDLDVLLVEIIQTVIKSVDAQVAAILTPSDGETGGLVIRNAWGLRDDHVDAIKLVDGRRVVDAVFEDGKHLLVGHDAVAERLDCSGTDASVTGILALPLQVSGRKLGVILLANPDTDFTGDSQRLAETVCDMAAMALDNAQLVQARIERERLRGELDLAQEVQANMFPSGDLAVGDVRIASAFRCADETGGDYYTYLERDGRLVALIADVTGHGLGAALFTTAAHAIIQQQLQAGAPVVPALRTLNEGLYLTKSGRFMTAALLEIDPETRQCTYFSAGHNPLLWITGGTVNWLGSQGMPLGILPEFMDEIPVEMQFNKGDTLVLYTDGFTEAFNPAGECWGEDAFADMVLRGLGEFDDPKDLVDYIFRETDRYCDGEVQKDDLTLSVIRIG